MALMRSQNRQGAEHRNGHRSRLIVDGCVENGGLVGHFFGEDENAGLQFDKFVQFMKDLQIEVTDTNQLLILIWYYDSI